jgi:hypothetical protein
MATEFEKIVSVSGLSGLYKVAANRHNGLIIEDLKTGERKFAPSRTYQFSLLASIGIYTDDGTEDLKIVFGKIAANPGEVPAANVPDGELRQYFKQVLPNHDEDMVRISDIRKVIKWYTILKELDALPTADDTADKAETATKEEE